MKSHTRLRPLLGAWVFLCIPLLSFAQTQTLSMQEAVALALDNNPQIGITKLDIAKAKQERVVAKSGLLPTVNAAGQIAHYFQLPAFFGFGATTSPTGKIPYGRFGGNDQAAAWLFASQPLYNANVMPSLKLSKLREEESKIALTGKQTEIAASVKQTYLQILVLQEKIKLQQESIKRNEVALKDAKSLLAKGKALRVDTLRAYTSLKILEPELLKMKYAIETNTLQLKTLTGIASTQEIELKDSLAIPASSVLPAETEVYETAKSNRADLLGQALQEKIYDQQVKLSSAAAKPVVAAVGQYQVQTQTNNFEYGNAYYPSNSFVGLQVTVPLFNGFRNDARARQATLSKQQASAKLKDDYEQLRALAHQAWANCDESLIRLRTTQTVRETAELSYSIVEYRYAGGVSSRLELTDAELAYSTAQSNYLEAVYDYLSARILLYRVMGKVE